MTHADRRVEVVEEHVRLENDHDFAARIATFGRARYGVVAGDETFELGFTGTHTWGGLRALWMAVSRRRA